MEIEQLVGKNAPQFTLLNQNSEKIQLKQLLGKKVVLYFYPRALTPGCTTQACGVRDNLSKFKKLNTVVLGISPDPVIKLNRFMEKKDLNFDLLSDENHEIALKYSAWGKKKFMGKEYDGIKRSTFLIDETGEIIHVITKVNTRSHHDDLIKLIKGKS